MSNKNLKQRIRDGDQVLGVSVPINPDRDRLERILSKDNYYFVSIDSQHSAYNEDTLAQFCGMASDIGIPVQFQIKNTRHAYLVGNHLDLGPSGIEIPQVEDETTVDEALDYFYYPQRGIRSWGGVHRYGIDETPDRLDYATAWKHIHIIRSNQSTIVCATSPSSSTELASVSATDLRPSPEKQVSLHGRHGSNNL